MVNESRPAGKTQCSGCSPPNRVSEPSSPKMAVTSAPSKAETTAFLPLLTIVICQVLPVNEARLRLSKNQDRCFRWHPRSEAARQKSGSWLPGLTPSGKQLLDPSRLQAPSQNIIGRSCFADLDRAAINLVGGGVTITTGIPRNLTVFKFRRHVAACDWLQPRRQRYSRKISGSTPGLARLSASGPDEFEPELTSGRRGGRRAADHLNQAVLHI